ncbi:hypothetical protein acsn021_35800 [Anaerocolumna cellulosilytica]|uniref:Stage 0 sporulation protein A homolog n=1 Tax=Anaerocolumna cellulosilytica TaxID=433286 RepID=A0A6S6RB10_9FIRM|nr:ATP-binding protein [Anaerocolumna cellulosilytica]MBB5195478.1 signal transduction histidine kinase/ActR/RegA family two-component response regulator [Anaerocolumna cellulosilytica]BCJ96011.1 hypothetical protein acsn021_35800 [Anaerocolumna cellulosilytica]
MLKDLPGSKLWKILFITILGVTLITASVIMTFNSHKNEIINQQKEQIITNAETASRSLQTFFIEKCHGMDLYFNSIVFNIENSEILKTQMKDILEQYYQKEKEYIHNLSFITAEKGKELLDTLSQNSNNTFCSNYEYQPEGFFVLYLIKPLYIEKEFIGIIKAGINLNKVYDKILYPVQVGDKGYCTVKDQNGIILMHGTKSQIGINSKEDRKKLHPELDPKGVDQLVENQIGGKSGSDIVNSYWWDNVEAGKVKKIIGYTPVSVVENYWVVSVIMEYAQIAGILHRTLGITLLVGLVLVLFFGTLIYYVTKELKSSRYMQKEWMYERELSEAVYQLRKQEEKVQQYDRLQTMGILTGTIAHEFNNLMTPILIYCELLLQGINNVSERQEAVSEIAAAAKRCTELSRQLLDYGRTENIEAKMLVFDAAAAIKSTLKMTEKLIPKEVRLVPFISTKPVRILGNQGTLNQIIINLCTNAYQAMRNTGGEIQIVLENRQDTALLIIKDTGCGMDEEVLSNIFEPFFTTKMPGEGTGLGLPVVHRLVSKMKGVITVESELGQGTTFTITFPIVAVSEGQENSKGTKQEYIIARNRRVMILDDKKEIVKSIARGLEKINWTTEGYTNPVKAYAHLKENSEKIDILLTDYSMPIINGLELSTVIKKLNPNIRIIVMTGYLEKDLETYIEKGIIDAYVIKPVSVKEIVETANKLYSDNNYDLILRN